MAVWFIGYFVVGILIGITATTTGCNNEGEVVFIVCMWPLIVLFGVVILFARLLIETGKFIVKKLEKIQ